MKIGKIYPILFAMFTLAACGGSAGSIGDQAKQLIITAQAPSQVAAVDEGTYQVQLYYSVNGEKGESFFGPAEAPSYNTDNDQYYVRIDNVVDGDYYLGFYLVGTSEGQAVTLSGIETPVTVSGTETSVSLNEGDWNLTAYDDDEDGLANFDEILASTSPFNEDSDGDGVLDSVDAFPVDASITYDFDGDGVGDEQDNDMDNDGLANDDEVLAGTDPIDPDSDNDNVQDGADNCPLNSNLSQTDTDGDGQGDSCDADDDNDGVTDTQEAVLDTNPLVADSDGDGVNDGQDAFPTSASETTDNDGDGTGNNADTDDDNDGVSDIAEIAQGSNPLVGDTDEDGVADGADNCVLVSNAGQNNNDGDDQGDACDTDDDNDGLTDDEEAAVGTDGFVTNSKVADSDGDGFEDADDNCPLVYNVDQTADADADGFGTACDCDDTVDTINQLSEDSPDPQITDSNCDGIDGNKYKAVFVSATGSASANDTDMANPTADLDGALEYAQEQGFQVYLATGDYNVTELVVQDGVSFFGGFSLSYLSRDTLGATYSTRFINNETNDEHSVLSLADLEQPITIGGIIFYNNSETSEQTGLVINNATVILESNRFEGSADAESEELLVTQNAVVTLNANQFYGYASAMSYGFVANQSTGFATNNLFVMGDAEHTVGLNLVSSPLAVSNNTIDGGQHTNGSAYAVKFDSATPTIANNIFITSNDRNQASVYCESGVLSDEVELKNNLFLRYSTNDLLYPAYIDCDGTNITSNAELEALDELDADDNLVSSVKAISDLANVLDVANYYELVAGSHTADTSSLSPINHGMDTDDADYGGVAFDLFGGDRVGGSYDIGASEF